MNLIATKLHTIIKKNVIDNRGYNAWLSIGLILRDKLDLLEPDYCTDESINYLSFNSNNKRMKLKTSRFLTRKLNLNNGFLKDDVIRNIADNTNSELFGETGFETKLDNGIKITENYKNCVGGSSCMTGCNSDYTKLYEMNPDRFFQLVVTSDKDSARAIVHKLDNGKMLVGRIYSTARHLKDYMINCISNRSWLYANNVPGGDKSSWVMSGLEYEDGYIPFMDTLTEACTCEKGLTVSYGGCNCAGTLDSTCGELGSGYECSSCGNRISEDDMYNINGDYYCNDCYSELFFFCESCSEDCSVEGMIEIEDKEIYVCGYCAEHNYYRCEECGSYFSEATSTNNGYVCQSCLEDYSYCESCETYMQEGEMVDDEFVCQECLDGADYHQCVNCKEYFREDGEKIDGEFYCEECFIEKHSLVKD